MKTTLFILIATLYSVAMYAQTPVPGGPISGTWTLAGSPYQVMGETTIPNGQTLTIEPGVLVEWQGSYTMSVQGRILAIGTVSDSIRFTAADTATGWRSIQFKQTPPANDTSRFAFCAFSYGKAHGAFPDNCGGAICVLEFSKLVIDHCLFDRNEARDTVINPGPTNPNSAGGAIALDSASPVIKNSRFTNNIAVAGGAIICGMGCNASIANNEFFDNTAVSYYGWWGQGFGGALCIYDESNPSVSGNIFRNNLAETGGGAIGIVINCSPEIDHNLIDHNTAYAVGGGIEVQDNCNPNILNNTIASNGASGAGIHIWLNSSPQIRNNILWDNNSGYEQVWIDDTSVPDFYYDDIQGGQAAFGGFPHTGVYLNCIDADPEFGDPLAGIFCLCENYLSPCVNSGDPDPMYNDPDGSRNDMGAVWPPCTCPVIVPEPNPQNISVYPNPIDGNMNIGYRLMKEETVTLVLFNMVGDALINRAYERQQAGEYHIQLDVSDLAAGIYLIRLQAGVIFVTRKIVKH
jgi:hypothetical protein